MIKQYWKDIYRAHRKAIKDDGYIDSIIFKEALDGLNKTDYLALRKAGHFLSKLIDKRAPRILWVHRQDGCVIKSTPRFDFPHGIDSAVVNCRCSTMELLK